MKRFSLKKILLVFVFCTTFLSLTSKPTKAQTVLFQDNFDDDPEGSIPSDWIVSRNRQWGNPVLTCYYQGSPITWEVKNGALGIKIEGPGCVTEIIPKTFELGGFINNYVYEFDMAMPGSVNVDRNFVFKYKNPENWYGFHIISNKVIFQKPIGSYYREETYYYSFIANQTYRFRVEVEGDQIRLLINGSAVTTIIDSSPFLAEATVGLQASVGAISVSEVWFDNVRVESLEEEVTPLILLPGLGASWNTEAMVGGKTDIPPEQWQMTPFVKCYDGLIKSLENAGYVQGDNFFVYSYDWRRPLDQAADQLKNFINQKFPGTDTKIDLVGHSLGGLVARTYAQKYGTGKIDQLITLGSPHEGVVQSYLAWEGGEVSDRWDWSSVALGLLLQINKTGFQTDVQALRQLVPSTKDILPIFDFLKKGATTVNWQTQSQKNNYLNSLKSNVSQIFDQLIAIFGTGKDTPRWYQVKPASTIEKLLGKWEDGKPTSTENEDGDQTVLKTSAQVAGDPAESLNLNHRDLVQNQTAIEKIFALLGLPPENITELPAFNRTSALVFLLASPAQLKVIDPNGNKFFSDTLGFIIINEPQAGEYQTEITPLGQGGNYHLYLGQLTENKDLWTQIKESVAPGETDIFRFTINSQSPKTNPLVDADGLYYLKLARLRLTPLNLSPRTTNSLNLTITLTENHQYSQAKTQAERLLNNLFNERKGKTAVQDRQEIYLAILDISQAYIKICQAGSVSFSQRTELKNLSLTENLLNTYRRRLEILNNQGKAKDEQAVSFEKAEENLAQAKNNYPTNLPATYIYSLITRLLLYEI